MDRNMLPIVGYTNHLSVAPGDSLDVMVSSFGAKNYTADFRRIIQGDTNPEGPGYKDELIPVDLGGTRGAIAKPFVTHFNALNLDTYMRVAPELYLKVRKEQQGGFLMRIFAASLAQST